MFSKREDERTTVPITYYVTARAIEKTNNIFTLFDQIPLRQYLKMLDWAKELIQKNNLELAITILEDLIQKHPFYPDSYTVLGDLYARQKQIDLAVKLYQSVIQLCPFDHYSAYKMALHQNPKQDVTELQKNIKEMKEAEDDHRLWYHQKLHNKLCALQIDVGTGLNISSPDWDYKDISLSNGAVVDAFLAERAKEHGKFEVANYYFERAILKFEHDFISLTSRAADYHRTDTDKAIAELTKYIEKYHYPLGYYARFNVYYGLDNNEMAQADLVNFFTNAEVEDMEIVEEHREMLISFLEGVDLFVENIEDGADADDQSLKSIIKKMNLEIGIKNVSILDTTKSSISSSLQSHFLPVSFPKISQTLDSLRKGTYKKDITDIVSEVTEAIHQNPLKADLYATRGMIYESKDFIQARLDYSIALWLADEKNKPVYYYMRGVNFLKSGEHISAQENLNRALTLTTAENEKIRASRRKTLINNFATECLAKGNVHLGFEEYSTAETIFKLGIERNPSLDLYLKCTSAMEAQNKDYSEIIEFLTEAPKKITLTGNPLQMFNSQLQYLRKKLLGSKFPESKVDATGTQEPPKKKKAPRRKLTTMMPSSTRRRSSHNHISTLLKYEIDTSEISVDLENIVFDGRDEEEKKISKAESEARKKLNKKLREKEKRHELLQQRKSKQKSICVSTDEGDTSESQSPEFSSVHSPSSTSISSRELSDAMTVTFTDVEKKVFDFLKSLVPADKASEYKIYLVGGSAYDKAREAQMGIAPCIANDIDIVTSIPPEILGNVMSAIPEVNNLFCLKMGNAKIDIYHQPDLCRLAKDARTRDFLTLYIDPEGNILDPTGFGISSMRAGKLYCVKAPTEIFKQDPLIILRAIYTSTKRKLDLGGFKKNIATDKELLIPTLTTNGETKSLLHPRRINLYFTKLFSQHMASENLIILKKLNLYETLFPGVHKEMMAEFEWIKSQIANTNSCTWPKVATIYAIFIASAIAQRVPENAMQRLSDKTINNKIRSAATAIFNGSLLFKEAFGNVDGLLHHLRSPLIEYKNYHAELDNADDEENECKTSLKMR
jgi:tetratricopeptide (TPR) repeat protein